MTLLDALLALVVDAALGGWLGAMAFFSFVGAPRAFAVHGPEVAGEYVNDVFPRYYVVGVALGVVALASTAVLAVVGGAAPALVAVGGATLVAVAAHAYARWVLVPRMTAADDDAFQQYHRQSVLLNGAAMLAAASGLVASHLYIG